MSSKFIECRHQDRRPLKTAVAFYSNGNWNLKKYAVGQTRDVSPQGACIRTSLDHMPEKGSPLLLVLIPENETPSFRSATLVRIKGKVVWVNPDAKRFGVYFS